MIVCVAEDRRTHEPALRVLLYSLFRTNSDTRVVIFSPDPSPSFKQWVGCFPAFELRQDRAQGPVGWAVKPSVLLRLLDGGSDEVVWLDSDILVTGSLAGVFSELGRDDLVIAEEALAGQARTDTGAARGHAWGFDVGRTLEGAVNTCVMRVTPRHRKILEAWRSCMDQERFRAAQRLPFSERPIHLASDQDVLTALLSSAQFSDVNLKFLRRGRQILQYYGPYGFTTQERLSALIHGMPTFIHSQASAPWASRAKTGPDMRGYLLSSLTDTSPYMLLASRDSKILEGDTSWLAARTGLGRLMRRIGFGSPSLTGLPASAVTDLFRLFARMTRFKI